MVTYFADCRHEISSFLEGNNVYDGNGVLFSIVTGPSLREKVFTGYCRAGFPARSYPRSENYNCHRIAAFYFTHQAGIAHGYLLRKS